jgi:hypothetical protein
MITMSSMLKPGWWRGGRIIAAALLLSAAAGCGMVGLAYGQAERLAYWWLDGHLDFSDTQSPAAREALAQWAGWHRRAELPRLAELLERAAAEALQDTRPARVCEWIGLLEQRGEAAVEQALPAAAALALGLDAAQLAHLARHQARTAQTWREEFLDTAAEARQRAALDRTLDRVETVYGRLDAAQRERLARGLAASPFDAARWIGERERRQRDALQTLEQLRATPTSTEAATALLRGTWQRVQRSPDPAYREHAARLQAYRCEFAAEMHNGMRADQREAARQRLLGWRKDLLRYAPAPA